ncbi:helix-turn-helix domain-containing protein [Bradyrhizobium manausense]|uniref:IclR family transcriptional regulator n=1 Tax=Bradyrhizobium TaxID=374 RepID=UPI001BAE2574|nr:MULTISPECIES: helix-turn-helix domain-containing protein [Bradyrhizobium]MBR0825116.1 helix-turn-helix domain-containing protein [Bradyrhizobium manausense]UVO32440.1 helix-turn-helix domain-containing protein [Bradyrhizobium arachidis]
MRSQLTTSASISAAGSTVKSALRAIEILEFFMRERQPRAMSEIGAALGYPASSTTVLLKTLVGLGYLNFDRRTRVYFPTPKVTSLGDWIPTTLFGDSRVLEAMHDVHAATGEAVSIGTTNDVYLQYVKIIQSIHPLRFHVDEGTLRPLTQSALGWLLMSTMSDEKVDTIVRRANIATPNAADRVKPLDMIRKIREIRGKGHCSAENVPMLGGATICVLLPITIQNQPVALGLGGVAERIKQNASRYLSVLRQAARTVKAGDTGGQPNGTDV